MREGEKERGREKQSEEVKEREREGELPARTQHLSVVPAGDMVQKMEFL